MQVPTQKLGSFGASKQKLNAQVPGRYVESNRKLRCWSECLKIRPQCLDKLTDSYNESAKSNS